MATDDLPVRAALPSRDRILGVLRRGGRTVEELAAIIGLTANGVRAQLTGLERDGLVRRDALRHGAGAGKPPWVYAITATAEAEFSRAYVPVLTALAETLSETFDGRGLRQLFDRVGRRLAGRVVPPAGTSAPELAKLVLESLGAAVTIDARQAPVMVEGAACPLAATVRRCPGSCEMVRSLLANVTGVRVAERCVHDDAPRCRFAVG